MVQDRDVTIQTTNKKLYMANWIATIPTR